MALPKIEEARSFSDEALNEEILASKRKLFELRLQQATRRLDKPHEFKHTRHRLAQLLTVEGERQRQAEVRLTPSSEEE
jgi:large subunit ribosomal protein L29